ncbi:MAG: GGDEF domain-containing protein [Rhodoferax sp.]|nr:GGDEF domain-containing protein [Rhodoferax sp.]MCF8207923.1 GGDEF domain-containing protein [Rhodoferax sp.]
MAEDNLEPQVSTPAGPATTASAWVDETQVHKLSIRALFERTRKGVMAAPAGTLFLAWVVRDTVSLEVILVWMLVNSVPDLFTYFISTHALRKPPPDERLGVWLNWQVFFRALQGLAWGSACVFFHVQGENAFTNDLKVLMVLVAISATTTVNMAPSLRTLTAFNVGVLGVPLIFYAWLGDQQHLDFSLGMVILLGLQSTFGRDAARQFQQGLRELVRNHAISAELERLANTDALTGLANRRCFDETLATEWARARRNAQALAILMVDVDWFKRYNDHYGHPAGDACLAHIGRLLLGTLRRSGDLAARYGGEEFVVIIPGCNTAQAQELAGQLRHRVEAAALPHALALNGTVTISVGVAAMVPTDDHAHELLRQADQALYQAKRNGRNQVQAAV